MRFELLGEPLVVSRNASTAFLRCRHQSHSFVAVRHEDDGRDVAGVTRPAYKEKWHENQTDQRLRERSGQGPALLHGSVGLCQEGRLQQWPISVADRCLT